MKAHNIYDFSSDSNPIMLQHVFLPLLRDEIQTFMNVHNVHTIRKQNN